MRAVINTYLSITSSCIAAVIISRITKGRKLDMEIILNASLSGGVVMGASSVIIVRPYGAMLAGFITGIVSSLGFAYLGPFLRRKINLHDTCGVLYLYGIPGIAGGFISSIVVSKAETNFGLNYSSIFALDTNMRTPEQQGGYQLAALFLSIGMGLLGGAIAGLMTGTTGLFEPLPEDKFFDDRETWHECEIDHHTLFNLQVMRALSLSESRRTYVKQNITNVPTTVAEEQDLDNLNIEWSRG
jgi:ammonium transporter Rh